MSTNVLGVLITDRYLEDFSGLKDAQILSKLLNHIDVIYGGRANETYLNHTFKDWTKEPYILGGWKKSNKTAEDLNDVLTLVEPLGNGNVYLAGEAILGGDFEFDSGCMFPATDAPTSAPTSASPGKGSTLVVMWLLFLQVRWSS